MTQSGHITLFIWVNNWMESVLRLALDLAAAAFLALALHWLGRMSVKTKPKRLKIWPGVVPSQACDVLHGWCSMMKITDVSGLDYMRERDFDETPGVGPMLHHADLCYELVLLACNSVLGHVCCKKAWADLLLLEPGLKGNGKKKKDALDLELSKSLRTLMYWFREFAKGGLFEGQTTQRHRPTTEGPIGGTLRCLPPVPSCAGIAFKSAEKETFSSVESLAKIL